MSESNGKAADGGTKGRRNLLSLGLTAIVGAVATVASRGNIAEAGHDGTNIFHLKEVNVGEGTATVLHAAVPLGTPGPTTPPGSALMITNGDGTPGKGFALFAVANTGAAGAIRGQGSDVPGVRGSSAQGNGVEGFSDAGAGVRGSSISGAGLVGSSTSAAGVRGTSSTGPGVAAHSPSPDSPALVATWIGDPNSPTPHSGIFGSTVALAAPGIHGQAPQLGVLGRSGSPNGGPPSGSGKGVLGQSGSGVGVAGTSESGPGIGGSSSSGPGVVGQSASGPGVVAISNTGPGLTAQSSSPTNVALAGQWTGDPSSSTPHSGVFGSSNGNAPGIHGQSPQVGVLGRSGPPNGGDPLGNGVGVRGESAGGPGVLGRSLTGAGVSGVGQQGPGVRGQSQTGPGVIGFANATNPGVVGEASASRAGVNGHAATGQPAIHGINESGGPAVLGTASQANGRGVVAENLAGAIALDVIGKARFATAGVAVIPADDSAVPVTAPVDPATSIVLVTPLADTERRAIFVRLAPGSFTINIDDKSHPPIPVAWLLIEHN